MSDRLVNSVYDGLPERPDLVDVVIEIENPAECLLWRGDVVAFRAEHHDRRANVTKIDGGSIRHLDAAGRQIVADKQLIDDELDLLGIEVDVPSPPAFEFQIARRLGVDLGVNVILLRP